MKAYATRPGKCFGSYFRGGGDIVFRQHPVGGNKDVRNKEPRSVSPNYL